MKKIILLSSLTASILLAGSITFNNASSNPQRVSPILGDKILSFNNSIFKAKKSVVNISTTKQITRSKQTQRMLNDPFFREFFGRNFKMPKNKKASSLGSGVVISSDGYIVTNHHVVENADEILVTLLDSSKEYKAKVIGLDPASDLAVIKIDRKDLHAISFANSKEILEGDVVFAIGNPFGVGEAVTQGIISALNKSGIGLNQYEDFIQTDASINPGNSGGALVDSRGALIGINTAILSRSGGNNGIGFAIPSNMVKSVAKTLIEQGKIERGYMGVSIGNLNKDMKEVYTNQEGALIMSVEKNKPASKAGLKRGDLIIKINDKKIANAHELKNTIGSFKPDTKINVTYERNDKIKTATLTLVNLKSMKNAKNISDTNNFLEGLNIEELNDKIRYENKIPRDINGVLITKVKENSKASKEGFHQGDIIIQIEQKVIKSIDDLNNAFDNIKRKKIKVWIYRRGYVMPILVR